MCMRVRLLKRCSMVVSELYADEERRFLLLASDGDDKTQLIMVTCNDDKTIDDRSW